MHHGGLVNLGQSAYKLYDGPRHYIDTVGSNYFITLLSNYFLRYFTFAYSTTEAVILQYILTHIKVGTTTYR